MCGLCGFVGKGDRGVLEAMTGVLTHRGPDDSGLWSDENARVFLGHTRLSVLDIAGGSQPMWTRDGRLGVVFNGEIYNHSELRRELEKRGHRFISHHSDTEVLLHGYREWGPKLPEHLNGMWAFVLLDRQERNLFLSRDRFGKKPLYYTRQHGLFAFASEIKALKQHPDVQCTVSPLGLKKYFAYGFIPAPRTLYNEICTLPGGCNLVFCLSEENPSLKRYWAFELEPDVAVSREGIARWGEELRELLGRAVARRMVADVPVGVFLSGGIDSTTVAALAKAAGTGRVDTFTVGFEEESFDESDHARAAAHALGTAHHQTVLSLERGLELLPGIMARLDEPVADSSLLPTSLLCGFARKEVTVALSGDGGDELFAGYDPFRALRLASWYDRLTPKPVHRAIRMLAARLPVSHRNMSLDFRIKRTLRGMSHPRALWNPVWLGPLEPPELEELFGEPMDPEEVYSEAIDCWEECTGSSLVDRTLQFYTRLYLQDDILVKTDRMSMLHSLEVRSPFLDIEVVDFVRRIPAEFKFRNGTGKYLLRSATRPLLPPHVVDRPKKGFGVPVGRWFKEGSLTVGCPLDRLSGAVVARLRTEHVAGAEDHRLFLWSLWVLERVMGCATSAGEGEAL